MNDNYIKDRMKDEVVVVTEIPTTDSIQAASSVMEAYQNANKWLDTIKEYLLIDVGCVFFSNYVHELAHTMPERFDKFGDILHTMNLKVPYPATASLAITENRDIPNAFTYIFKILDSISEALIQYIDLSSKEGKRSAAISAEELLVDIQSEYSHLYRMEKVYHATKDAIEFDKWVAQYITNKNSLID